MKGTISKKYNLIVKKMWKAAIDECNNAKALAIENDLIVHQFMDDWQSRAKFRLKANGKMPNAHNTVVSIVYSASQKAQLVHK